jgi:hypothetical protein
MSDAIVPIERNLLGAILKDNQVLARVQRRLRAGDFFLDSHRRILAAMVAQSGGFDCSTLTFELQKRGELSSIGGVGYLVSFDIGLRPHLRVVDEWIKLIAEASMARRVAAETARFSSELETPGVDARAALATHRDRLAEIERDSIQAPGNRMFAGALTFAAEAEATVDWLVQDLIHRAGNGISCGEPKASKSFATLDLGCAVSCGVPWMGHRVPKRAKVAVVSREDDPGLTRRRIKKLIAGRREYSTFSDEWMLVNTRQQQADFQVENPSHMDRLIDELGHFGAELVILDVFRTLHHADENDNSEMAQVLAKITRIQTELQSASLLVHHNAKADNPNPFRGLRGASCIHGWMEYGMAISVVNPEADRADYVRRIQFESKECVSGDIFYKIVESPDHATVRLDQTQMERPRARNKVSVLPPPRDGKNGAAGGNN